MINRRNILKAAAPIIAMPFIGRHAFAAGKFNLRWGVAFANTDPIAVWAKKAADNIAKSTNGEVRIRVFPDGQLGSDTDMLRQTRIGAIDLYGPSPFTIAPLVPSAAAVGLPFTVKNSADVEKVSTSPAFEAIDQDFQKVGLKSVSTLWTSGIRQITNNKMPIGKPDDLAGLKIRVPTSPIMLSLFRTFGASPVAMDVSELYMALKTELVDAEENPFVVIKSRKFYEVQKYCSVTNHVFGTCFSAFSKQSWDKIPPDIQAIITKELDAAGAAQRKEADDNDAQLKDDLAKAGMVMNTPDAAPFRDRLMQANFYADAKKSIGDDVFTKIEAVVGKLT